MKVAPLRDRVTHWVHSLHAQRRESEKERRNVGRSRRGEAESYRARKPATRTTPGAPLKSWLAKFTSFGASLRGALRGVGSGIATWRRTTRILPNATCR